MCIGDTPRSEEGSDLGLEIAGREVVFEQGAVLQGLVPAFDLAPCLRMTATNYDRSQRDTKAAVGVAVLFVSECYKPFLKNGRFSHSQNERSDR